MHRLVAVLAPLLLLLALAAPEAAFAHPLGNFTINRYARLEVQPGLVRLRYVLDEAEIPTYQDLALLHPGGGAPTAPEQQAFLGARVEQLRANLLLSVGGQRVAIELEPGTAELSFPPGQGGLPLLRLTAWFRAALPADASPIARIALRDDNYADRLGWKEIVVRAAAGASIERNSATAVDQSDELRSYPQDMLSSPLDVRSAEFTVNLAAGAGSGAAGNLLQPRGSGGDPLQAATAAFTALVSVQRLSPFFVLFALLAAAALGGLHALSPGHGKTIVGAYLVGSRGTARHAAVLGLTVTATHTAGVFALGLVTLFAARFVTPERLYPWLGGVSGLLVAAIGAALLGVRWRAARGGRRSDQHDHAHGHAHLHDHAAGARVIEHDHGGGPHRHVLPAAERIGWRGLLALGVSGGLLPCPSALVVLLAAIALHRVAFGIALVLAFSAGLAGVLTAIGLVLVYARGLFARRRLELGLGRLLPVASAAVVLALGLGIALQALAQGGLLRL